MARERQSEIDILFINNLHDLAMVEVFRAGIGKKAFILLPSFPFMYIGKIKDVIDDMVVLDVEVTSVAALEKKEWVIHIHSIEVFYIERELGPKIPDLK